MSGFNATITAIRKITGAKATGKPALTSVTLKGDIPVRVESPHEGHRRVAQANGVEVQRIVRVMAGAFRAISYDPAPQDRITFTLRAPGETFAAETRVVSHVSRTQPGAIGLIDHFTLMLDTAEDNA